MALEAQLSFYFFTFICVNPILNNIAAPLRNTGVTESLTVLSFFSLFRSYNNMQLEPRRPLLFRMCCWTNKQIDPFCLSWLV